MESASGNDQETTIRRDISEAGETRENANGVSEPATPDLATVVAEMRRLGIRTYKTATLEIVLDEAPAASPQEMPMKTRAEMEAAMAEHRNRTLFGATSMRPRLRPRT
jgi:hypothetical protein